MALQRYTVPVDGTIPIQALLYTDEQLLASQEGVGIYDGLQKSPQHQAGTIHTTSHRLFYIDSKDSEYASFAVDLEYVNQTDYYAGLFTSSPKVTLYLMGKGVNSNTTPSSGALEISDAPNNGGTWECEVCAHKNRDPVGRSPSSAQVCELCGVPRSTQAQHPSTSQLSTSLPSNSLHNLKHSVSSVSSPAATPASRSRELSAIPCPACTFLNHPSLPECEICGTLLPSVAQAQSITDRTKSAPTTRPTSPEPDDDGGGPVGSRRMIKVSFRKGGDKGLYTILKRSLKSKAWENRPAQLYKSSKMASTGGDNNTTTRGGITGILRTVETSAQGRDSDLKDALQDLEALMIKARDMVHLAAELNEKLTSATSASSSNVATPSSSSPALSTASSSQELPEEAAFIRSSLSQLGLQMTNVPVTNDMVKDEDKWINELARELAGVLKRMMKDRGIIALDEVWGGWNRARGVALLPPTTFLQVIPLLPQHTTPPIHKRTFKKSNLIVLHTPPYSPPAFSERLTKHLQTRGPKTTMEVAAEEQITVALAKEMIDDTEMRGEVIRDDAECVIIESGATGVSSGGVGEAGVMWWPNIFVGCVWDGQTFD